jgi:excinuclease ABC subunit A
VATATEIYDYLRLLYARVGHTFCLNCGEEVRKDTLDEIAARVLALPTERRFYVLYELKLTSEAPSPGTKAKKQARPGPEAIRQALVNLRKRGFNRFTGTAASFLQRRKICWHGFLKTGVCAGGPAGAWTRNSSLLMDSIEICYREGRGETILEFMPEAPAAQNGADCVVRNKRWRGGIWGRGSAASNSSSTSD